MLWKKSYNKKWEEQVTKQSDFNDQRFIKYEGRDNRVVNHEWWGKL